MTRYRWRPLRMLCRVGVHRWTTGPFWPSCHGCKWCRKTLWTPELRERHRAMIASGRQQLSKAAQDQKRCIHCRDIFPNAMTRDMHEHECDQRPEAK